MRLLVVGGGIAGLAAAHEATAAGADVTLVEGENRLGGKVGTERTDDGLVIEHGPDAVVAYRPAAVELMRELGLADQIVYVNPGRSVSLRSRGRLLPLPDGMGLVLPNRLWPFVTTPILSWRDKARAGLDLVLPRRLGSEDVSIGDFLRARLGSGVTTRFADPMLGGIYGAGVDDLSLDAVVPSLRENEESHRSLMLASLDAGRKARRAAPAGTRPGSPFRSLSQGMGSLVEALAARLRQEGVEIRTGTRVGELRHTDEGTDAELSDGTVVHADAVALAGGVRSSAELLDAHVPDAANLLRQIPLSTTNVVTLAYAESSFPGPVTSQGWLETGGAPVSGVTISSVKWAGRAPRGTVLLRAFVPDKIGPLAREADDAVLVERVSAHLTEVLGVAGPPVTTRVTRWSEVMPTYTVGHVRRALAIDTAVTQARPGWAVAGSALHGVGVPDCIADGRAVARRLVETSAS